jgi:hypothetical protein
MLVDPYYFPSKLAIFRSSKTFAKNLQNFSCHDQVVKNIVFSTAKNKNDDNFEVKLLTQYYNHYSITNINTGQEDSFEFDYDNCDYF